MLDSLVSIATITYKHYYSGPLLRNCSKRVKCKKGTLFIPWGILLFRDHKQQFISEGLNGEEKKIKNGGLGLPPENYLRQHPLECWKSPISIDMRLKLLSKQSHIKTNNSTFLYRVSTLSVQKELLSIWALSKLN